MQGQQDVDVAQSLAAVAEADRRVLDELEVHLARLELLAVALKAVAVRPSALVVAQGGHEDHEENEGRSSRSPTKFG